MRRATGIATIVLAVAALLEIWKELLDQLHALPKEVARLRGQR